MIIKIIRHSREAETIDGRLYIEGIPICDCAENALSALKAGEYLVVTQKCRQLHRNMPVVRIHKDVLPCCALCKKMKFVNINTKRPRKCPMLKPGNGVYHRDDGSIIVGEFIAPGCLKNTKEKFDIIYERIRKNLERGNPVTLCIIDETQVS